MVGYVRRVAVAMASVAVFTCLGMVHPLPAQQVHAAGIVVNSLADTTTDDDLCTLREAITTANTDTPVNTGGGSPVRGDCDGCRHLAGVSPPDRRRRWPGDWWRVAGAAGAHPVTIRLTHTCCRRGSPAVW